MHGDSAFNPDYEDAQVMETSPGNATGGPVLDAKPDSASARALNRWETQSFPASTVSSIRHLLYDMEKYERGKLKRSYTYAMRVYYRDATGGEQVNVSVKHAKGVEHAVEDLNHLIDIFGTSLLRIEVPLAKSCTVTAQPLLMHTIDFTGSTDGIQVHPSPNFNMSEFTKVQSALQPAVLNGPNLAAAISDEANRLLTEALRERDANEMRRKLSRLKVKFRELQQENEDLTAELKVLKSVESYSKMAKEAAPVLGALASVFAPESNLTKALNGIGAGNTPQGAVNPFGPDQQVRWDNLLRHVEQQGPQYLEVLYELLHQHGATAQQLSQLLSPS